MGSLGLLGVKGRVGVQGERGWSTNLKLIPYIIVSF